MLLRPRVDVKGGQQLCTEDNQVKHSKNTRAVYLFVTDPEEETPRLQCARQKYLKRKPQDG